MIASLCAFFFIALGCGSVIIFAGGDRGSFAERTALSLGAGLCAVPVIGTLFNVLRVPLDYINFLTTAGLIFLLTIVITARQKTFARFFTIPWRGFLNPSLIALTVLFSVTLFMYLKGSFRYSWFENGDPWLYAAAAKYIAINKTYETANWFWVSQPYPQGYEILMALMHQLSPSINWVMKFYNAFVISLSVPLFFFLARRLTHSAAAALFATALLAAMPAWLSHFIFPFSLTMSCLPFILYALFLSTDHPRWNAFVALGIAAAWLTHLYSAVIITFLCVVFWLVRVFCTGRLHKHLIVSIAAGVLFAGLFFWLPALRKFPYAQPGGLHIMIPLFKALMHDTLRGFYVACGLCCVIMLFFTDRIWLPPLVQWVRGLRSRWTRPLLFALGLCAALAALILPRRFMPLLGSGSTTYGLSHFLVLHPPGNYIQNPFGLGPVPVLVGLVWTIVTLVSIRTLFTRERFFEALIFTWGIVTFLGVHSAHFCVNIMPFRIWPFLALAVALAGGFLYVRAQDRMKKRWITPLAAILLIALSVPAWYYNKYTLNQNLWRDQWLGVKQSYTLYEWVKANLPADTMVYSFGVGQFVPIGYDMLSPAWDPEIDAYTLKDIEHSVADNYSFLKSKGYDYVIFDVSSLVYKFNAINPTLSETERAKIFMRDRGIFELKKGLMLRSPNLFVPVKTIENTGIVFKLVRNR